ncbi:unnamed protein product [[Candida] boidinii]|uniref:Unnamed protein product n=1 Tax=Candida boidinii TaxID=5477 RepID=A0ACB5TEL5_CANBO|nr:unnamed protein product [[Candida] boidinii]
MDKYPQELSKILAPLIVVQGLDTNSIQGPSINRDNENDKLFKFLQKNGEKVNRALPVVDSSTSSEFVQRLQDHNIGDTVWSDSTLTKSTNASCSYRIKYVTEEHLLFPIKSPSTSANSLESQSRSSSEPSSPISLQKSNPFNDIEKSHSILSPFNPESSIYQDGILDIEWIKKYLNYIPFLFISVHELHAIDENDDANVIEQSDHNLSNEINIIKEQITRRGINFISIVMCSKSSLLNPDLESRIDSIRKSTNLNAKNGLLFLPSVTIREYGIFVNNIMYSIKSMVNDFYLNIEKKLRKKFTLTKFPINYNSLAWSSRISLKFAIISELRNSITLTLNNGGDVSSSTSIGVRSMEVSYEQLVNYARSMGNITDKSWNQLRFWLDFTGFHITRCYLLLGETNLAYKKFDIHIQNIVSLLPLRKLSSKSFTFSGWLSIQFSWLAELVSLAPDTIIPIERALQPSMMSSKWYTGGDKQQQQQQQQPNSVVGGALMMPQPGYLFLQSISLLRRRKLGENSSKLGEHTSKFEAIDSYLSFQDNVNYDYSSELIKLLKKALDCFGRAKMTKFNRAESFIYFQLGEEYYYLKNYGLAMNNYIVALSIFKNEKWSRITSSILIRMYKCSLNMENYKDATLYYHYLCTIKTSLLPNNITSIVDPNLEFPKNLSSVILKTDNDNKLFEAKILFSRINCSFNDKLNFQIKIKPLTNNLIEFLKIDSLMISFTNNLKPIYLSSDNSQNINVAKFLTIIDQFKLEKINIDENDGIIDAFTGGFNGNFGDNKMTKVLEILIDSEKVSVYTIDKIVIRGKLNNSISIVYNIPIIKTPWDSKYKWFIENGDDEGSNKFKIIETIHPETIEVFPKKPKTVISFDHAKTSFYGQNFPIVLTIKNNDDDKFGIKLDSSVEMVNTQKMDSVTNNGNLDSCWLESVQSESPSFGSEYASMRCPVLKSGDESSYVLYIKIPDQAVMDTDFKIKAGITITHFVDDDPDVPVEIRKICEVPIGQLLKTVTTISPRVDTIGIPSLFLIDKVKTVAIPPHRRIWASDVQLSLSDSTDTDTAVQVVATRLFIKPMGDDEFDSKLILNENSNFTIDLNNFKLIEFLFDISSIGNKLKRKFGVELYLEIDWRFKSGQSPISVFKSKIWSGGLSYMDPRVLADIEFINNENDKRHFDLVFVVENPTSKILQFSASLKQSDKFRILGTNNQSFSILPHMCQTIRFDALALSIPPGSNEEPLRLPQFKVYDLNFKVHLEPLSASKHLEHRKDGLYITL